MRHLPNVAALLLLAGAANATRSLHGEEGEDSQKASTTSQTESTTNPSSPIPVREEEQPSAAHELPSERIGAFEANPWTRLIASDDVTLTVFGRLQMDTMWAHGNGAYDATDGAEIRAARIGVTGTLFDLFTYKAEYDFAGGDVDFKDVTVGTSLSFADLTVGNFKEPFSLEELTSSRFITFMERSVANAFVPGRNLGIMLSRYDEDMANLNLATGLFWETDDDTGIAGGSGTGGRDNTYHITNRVTVAPVANEETVVHVGVSHQWIGGFENGAFEIEQRPEAHLMNKVADTGSIPSDGGQNLGFELAFDQGPFSVQGEFILSALDQQGGSNPDYFGWYTETSYYLTGEHRNYKAKGGRFDRPAVDHGVTRGDWMAGAVQLAARYSQLDLDDGPTDQKLEDVTVGINWWLNSHTRISANYIHSWYEDAGDDDHADIFLTRLQIDF